MFVLFWEVVWQLQTWILFFSKGIVFFHGSVTNSYGEYTIFGCFPKHPNQADQNTWRKTNHTELDMSRPSYRLNVWTLFFGGGRWNSLQILKWQNKASNFLYKVPNQNQIAAGCCDKSKLGGLVSTYEFPYIRTKRDERYHHLGVSENRGTPKSSIFIGISIIFTIHFGGFIPIFGNPPFRMKLSTFDGSSVALARNYRTYEKTSPKFSPCLKLIITHRF